MKVSFSIFSALLCALLLLSVPNTSFAWQSEAATLQFSAAGKMQNEGLYDMAAGEWTKFIKDHPDDNRVDKAYYYRGICYLMDGKLDDAAKSLDAVIKNYPKSTKLGDANYYLGVSQYSMGQAGKADMYDAAAETFGKLLTDFPAGKQAAQATFYRGECFYARDKKKEAAEMYAALVDKYPSSKLAADALYALGVTREELGDFPAAGKAYDSFLKAYPQNPLVTEVGMRKGETLFAAGDYSAAAAQFAAAAAVEGFAMADHATLRQAAALSQLKKYDEAAALYASIRKKFPQSALIPASNLAGGKCYYLAGDYGLAVKLLGAVIAAGGADVPEAAHWSARSLLKNGEPAEALAVAEKAIAVAADSPMLPQLLMDQADATYEVPESRGKSVALFAALAEKYPDDPSAPQALYMAGFASLGQGEYEAAKSYADKFLAKYKDNELAVDVTYVAAESNLQLSQFAEAEKLFSQLLTDYPDHADVESWTVRRGLCLHLQKKYAETIDALTPSLAEIKTPSAVAEAQYLIGSSQAEEGQFDAAVKSLKASLAADPNWRQADDTLLVLAHSYNKLGNVGKAKTTVEKLIADFPASRLLDRAHYRLGEYTFAEGDFKKAAAEYEKVIDDSPDSVLVPHAMYGLGWARLSSKNYKAAAEVLTSLIDKYPQQNLIPRAKYARGMARQQLGDYAAAVEDIKALLAADPTEAEKSDSLYVLGLCQTGLKNYEEAAATFQQLLADDPDYASADNALYELGWALKSQDKDKESAKAFAKLAKKYPDSKLAPEAQYHVGESEYKAGDFKKAAVAYYDAMTKAGNSELGEKASHKLGWAYYRQDDFDNAQQTFSYERGTWPDGKLTADATFMEAECFTKQGKFTEALDLYEKVDNPSGKDFELLTLLHGGQAAGQLKDWKKSLEMLTACTTKFPDSDYLPEALYEQGWAQQNLGNKDEALKLYGQVVAKTKREVAARAQFMIGEIQFEQKKHSEAVASFFKVAYGYAYPTWQANAHYEAGRCFEVLKKVPQAIKQYEELIAKFPESDKADLAKKRLQDLK